MCGWSLSAQGSLHPDTPKPWVLCLLHPLLRVWGTLRSRSSLLPDPYTPCMTQSLPPQLRDILPSGKSRCGAGGPLGLHSLQETPLCCAGLWWVSLRESWPSCPGAPGSVPKASLFSGVQEPRQGGGAVLGVTPLLLLASSSISCTKGRVQGGALASRDPSSILQPR